MNSDQFSILLILKSFLLESMEVLVNASQGPNTLGSMVIAT